MTPEPPAAAGATGAAEGFWEPHYAASTPGTGGPNPVLVFMVGSLTPGRVLDLGCGGEVTPCGWPNKGGRS